MDGGKVKLLWSQLQHTEGPIPWTAINEFASALINEPAIWKQLAKRYNKIALSTDNHSGYELLYIPAIFAKVAPKLSKETKLEISPFLVEKLCEAGFDDDDILLEAFSAACGSMGVVILPTVMDFILKEEDTYGAWVFLWGLLRLAKRADNELRNSVIDFCVDFLKKADNGEISLLDADCSAEILSDLGASEHVELLTRLSKKSKGTHSSVEYRASAEILAGKQGSYDFKEMWEEPVEEWLPSRWKTYKDWYEKDKTVAAAEEQYDDDQYHDEEEDDFQLYKTRKIVWRFLRSLDAAENFSDCYDDVSFIIINLLEYAWIHEGADVDQLNERVLKEVLFALFPRKVVGDRKFFEKIPEITAGFLQWLAKQEILPKGQKLADKVTEWSGQIVAAGMTPANWGMGKTFTMKAKAAGVDTTDEKAVRRYMAEYNRKILQIGPERQVESDKWSENKPPIPISEIPAKTGRNEPCPCGSGKKHKKCCGGIRTI
ncbi:MAG: YecA family protein [Sedimentisphaerales bacterium]